MKHARLKEAFSLVELLVAIGIVAVLAALLFGASARVIEGANSAKCISNMRQLTSSINSFASDNQNYPSCFTLSANYSWDGPYWMDQLLTYLPNQYPDPPGAPAGWFNRSKVFYCPSEKSHHPYSDYGPNGLVMYVKNNATPVRPQSLNHPARTMLLADSRWGTGQQGSFLIDGAFLSNPKQTGLTGSPYPPRHGNGKLVNLAFCDGHLETMTFDNLSTNRKTLWGVDGL